MDKMTSIQKGRIAKVCVSIIVVLVMVLLMRQFLGTKRFVIPSENTASPSDLALAYRWTQERNEYTFTTYIPENLYEYYTNKPRVPVRATTASGTTYYVNYSYYVTDPRDDKELKRDRGIVQRVRLERRTRGRRKTQSGDWIRPKPAVYDTILRARVRSEYPRYPIETLVDNEGDCEDTAILTASLLNLMGYDAVLLDVPEHMAVGISGGNVSFSGFHYH